MNPVNCAIIDPDKYFTLYFDALLQALGYSNITVFNSLKEFNKDIHCDLLFISINLIEETDVSKLIEELSDNRNIAVIYLLDEKNNEILESYDKKKSNLFVTKPIKKNQLIVNIEIALQKKKIANELQETKNRLDNFIMNLSEAVIIVNNKDQVNFANDKALDFLKLTEKDLFDKDINSVFKIYHTIHSQKVKISVKLFQHIRHKLHYPYCQINNKNLFINLTLFPISHERGVISEYLINFQDISSSKSEIESYLLSGSKENIDSKWISICSNCKKIYNEEEKRWLEVEHYLMMKESFHCSHTVCPNCAKKIYPSQYQDIFNASKSHKELSF